MGDVREVSDDLFRDLLRKERGFIVLEFWSPGCDVCRQVEPEVLRAQEELGSDAKFMKINTDHNGRLAAKYQVVGTPTFVFFCRGEKVGDAVGYVNSTILRNTVRDLLRHSASCPVGKRISYEMDGYG
ncbi:MAG: thioredoxin fold domain-containing protein [Methanomassiliicoccales archaeon]|nr:thioredoxin fold domain-containing protein [Methanomassiliicoccales archaeon]